MPALGGKVRRGVARQFGYRVPEVSRCKKGANSGLRRVETEPDAALTVPGSGVVIRTGGAGATIAQVKQDAELLGKLIAVCLGECSGDPEAVAVVAKNACSYSVRYEMRLSPQVEALVRFEAPLTQF